MKESDLKTVILFLLNNNRPDFIAALVDKLPNIVLTNFFPMIDNLDNDDLSTYITGFLRVGNNLSLAKSIKFPYDVFAGNETVSDEIFNYIKQVNKDTSGLTLEDVLYNGAPKYMDWLQSIGDFFGGKTEPETSTTTETTSKVNWPLIASIMAGLIGFAFAVFKFYRKSP